MLAFAQVLIATRDGVGISADSVIYISVGREIAAGHGAVVPFGTPQPTPLGTRVGPLLPMVLSVTDRFGADPVMAARWLNALLFAGTVWLVGIIIRRATGLLWLAVCGSAFVATSRLMLAIHEMAWTEPIFLFLSTAAMFLLALHTSTGKIRPLAAACMMMLLCLLARWAGAALIVTAFVCLMLGNLSWRRKALAACFVTLLLCLPMFSGGPIWLRYIVQCLRVGPAITQPDSSDRAELVSNLASAADFVADWVWPRRLWRSSFNSVGNVAAAALVLAVLAALTLRARTSAAFKKPAGNAGLRAHLCWVMGLLLAAYPLFLLAVLIFFGKNRIGWSSRILSPLLIPGMLLAVLGGCSLWDDAGRRRRVAVVALLTCLAGLAIRLPLSVIRSIELAHASGAGSEGFHDAKWRASETIAAIKDLPAETALYTNAPDAIYFLAGRPAYWLPSRWNLANPGSLRDDDYTKPPGLEAALARGALIVLFDRLAWRGSMPSADDLSRYVAIEKSARFADGAFYAAANNGGLNHGAGREGAVSVRAAGITP